MRLLSTLAMGLAATGLFVATPETSQAQTPFSFSLDFGRGRGISYSQGGYSTFYQQQNFGHGHGYGYGNNFYGPSSYGYGHNHYQRPVIVQPEYYHWTPYRGYHSHGQVITPHRGHYHVRPY